jgi:hypothetical protein
LPVHGAALDQAGDYRQDNFSRVLDARCSALKESDFALLTAIESACS